MLLRTSLRSKAVEQAVAAGASQIVLAAAAIWSARRWEEFQDRAGASSRRPREKNQAPEKGKFPATAWITERENIG